MILMSWLDPPLTAVREVVARALAEDLGVLGDMTASLIPAGTDGRRRCSWPAKTGCWPAGCAPSRPSPPSTRRSRPASQLSDGVEVTPGQVIAEIDGPLASVLTAERTALNLLGHLSGIATLTRRFVAEAQGRSRIRDTRKTTPGLRALEKAAVRAGGGANHRGSLVRGILVKDNHLAGLSDHRGASARARHRWPGPSRRGRVRHPRPGQGGGGGRRRAWSCSTT